MRNKTVFVAVLGNLIVTIAKFIGASITGSGALFAEGVHSVADTANQALLIVGVKSSERKADARYNYGYGQNRFLWGLISACGIFFVGAGVTVYHGIVALIDKEVPHINATAYVILGISVLIEGWSFRTAVQELKHEGYSLAQALQSGNPTLLAVLFEDSAALIGLLLAGISIGITSLTGSYMFDAACSIIIGLMLGALAVMLIRINGQYLTEQAMPEDLQRKVETAILETGYVQEIVEMQSSLMDIDKYRAKVEIRINGDAYRRAHDRIMNSNACIEASEIPALIGDIVDFIKRQVTEKVKELAVLKIEIAGNGIHSDKIA
ncbi:MAG TPA: cation diffusion facilitator family transporter [Candidatus Fimivivens sp.]|nr:cation diffusion facilitator family transporter [Candidatus Fimivivens sp.]